MGVGMVFLEFLSSLFGFNMIVYIGCVLSVFFGIFFRNLY